MVIFLPRHKTAWESIGEGFAGGLEKGRSLAQEEKQAEKKFQREMQLVQEKEKAKYENKLNMLRGLGVDLTGNGNGLEGDQSETPSRSDQLQGGTNKHEGMKSGEGEPNEIDVKVPKLPHSQDKITRAMIADPNIGKQFQKENDLAIEEARHQEKNIRQQQKHEEKQKQQQQQFFHTETQKFDDNLEERAEAAERKNRALDRQMVNVDKIGWYDRAVSVLGGKYSDLLRSKTAQEFDANMLPQLEGQRQILGGILSDSDIRLLNQKIVTASKDPEANKIIAKAMKLENDLVIAKKRIGDEIKSRNGGYRPPNYKAEVDRIYNERYSGYIQEMQNEIMNLPDDKKKLEKIGRRKVGPGTVMTPEAVDMYADLANGDKDKAAKMMIEDGYDLE